MDPRAIALEVVVAGLAASVIGLDLATVATGYLAATALIATAAVAASLARSAVDWAHLDVWWGDERFLPTGDAERNETQARTALLDHVPVDPDRVHPMPASDSPNVSGDPDAAAAL